MSGATLVRVHGSWKRRAMFTSPALRERSARTAHRAPGEGDAAPVTPNQH
jgi:hypothetical protein